MYQPVHVCSSGAAAGIAIEREQEKIHQFVMGLDDSRFGSMCTNVIDHLPSLRDIYDKMIREEQQQEELGFVARQNTSSSSRRENQFDSSRKNEAQNRKDNSIMRSCALCSHCDKIGQVKSNCWEIIGFLEWYTERSGSRGQSEGPIGRGGRVSGARGRGQTNVAHASRSNSSSFPKYTLPALCTQLNEQYLGSPPW